ncbi:hypothetical protein SAMN05421663_105163 [Terribacillus halophilus]|uniref:Uncharacterized protein n=1 Tax=Terribacillus halophilus TaxID=361279 RepID=A0A1G6QP32_9BACI|nr:hypothetical protein [Terribacillus halophilus]SDC94083.1 hypothetical protein SAMN05421663_105163 [Terribacillus halophilus]
MDVKLNRKEKEYLENVLQALHNRRAAQEQIHIIEQQLLEHMEESRLHGIDPFEDLETPEEFVKEYLEINQTHRSTKQKSFFSKKHIFLGFSSFIMTYLLSQLILSMFLTPSFSPAYENTDFNYNILYNISDNLWWNTTLIMISLLSAAIITSFISFYAFRRMKRS